MAVGKIQAEKNTLVFGAAEDEERPFDEEDIIDEEDDIIELGRLAGDNYFSDGLRVETTIPATTPPTVETTVSPSNLANFLAAAITEAVEIWRDRGAPENSAREEVARRFPQFAGLQGMLEKTKEVRCALDVGEDQIDDVSLNASLLNAVDAVRGG